jgi:cytidyltransferase-like protein
MNLGEYLAQQLLEAGENKQTIALFPGAFKPPHKGHVDVVQKLLKAADQVVVLVSPKMRDGVSADESIAVWELYKNLFNGPVEVRIAAESPVGETYDVVKNNPDTDFIVAFGKGEMERYKSMEKYPNAKVFDAGTVEGANATNLRAAIANKDEEQIKKYLPEGIDVVDFLNALNTKNSANPLATPPPATPENTPPPTPQPEQPVQESSPATDANDDYYDYVEANRDKVEKAAQVFNYPIEDMMFAFQGGTPTVMSDDMWSELENSESHKIKDLKAAISLSLKLGINPRPYIDQIKKQKEMPLPLVLQYNPGKFYLVGGEVVLSILKALGAIPEVLVGNITPKPKSAVLPEPLHEVLDTKNDKHKQILKKFIAFAIKELGIQKPPSGLTLSKDNTKARSRHTFGTFSPDNDKIWLYVGNRNIADSLRTLAHELVHRKQAEDGRIDYNSGDTGSEIENEANAMAGVLLRKFGKQHEEIYQ